MLLRDRRCPECLPVREPQGGNPGGQKPEASYDAEAEFNTEFDDAWPVEFATYRFNASEVLFALDHDAYRAEVAGWKVDRAAEGDTAEAS